MAQLMSRGGSRTSPSGLVTVAELLDRHGSSVSELEPETVPSPAVPVGSILRREGRAPHEDQLDRRPHAPQPSAPQQSAPQRAGNPPPGDQRTGGLLVRRGAIAAGTLLAIGSVFGAAAVTDAARTADSSPVTDGYAGQGRLDQQAPAEGVVPTVDPAALAGALDPGTGSPDSWLPVAFPGAATAPSGSGGAVDTDRSGPTGGTDRQVAPRSPGSATPHTPGQSDTPVAPDRQDDGGHADQGGTDPGSGGTDEGTDGGGQDDRDPGLIGGLAGTLGLAADAPPSDQGDSSDEDKGIIGNLIGALL